MERDEGGEESGGMTSIVLADDMDLVTSGARAALIQRVEWQISAECHALSELDRTLKAQPPEVLVCGDRLDPALDAFKLLALLRSRSRHMRIILLGSVSDGLLIGELFDAGMNGYLYRAHPLRDFLPTAVQSVLLGYPYLSPTANAEYIVALHHGREWRLDAEAHMVLELLAKGRHAGEIATTLQIPLRRVYKIREKLRRRFGATTNEHLIIRAAAEGFTFPPD